MRRTAGNRVLAQHEMTLDEIVASCDGDLRGAVKALLLVNEQLESELLQIYVAVEHGTPSAAKKLLH
jgi:hypothetical protein